MSDFTANLTPRIDYLKFIRPMDYDQGQQLLQPIVAMLNDADCPINEKDNYKLTLLGGTESSNQKTRYVIEVWGLHCDRFVRGIERHWFEYLTRIDYRAPLKHTTTVSLDAYINQQVLSGKSKRNVSTFATKNRQKTNTRDVGGKGVIFGSRKSDSHTVIYYRGGDMPAIEMRLQNRKALDLGNQALYENETAETTEAFLNTLERRLKIAAMSELYAATGYSELIHLEGAMERAQALNNKMQAALEWSETQEEKEYWSSLTTEEQEALQRESWIPDEMLHGKRPSGK